MEWNPEVVRRVRGAMQDRARSQACLFKAFSSVMTREQAEALAREGIAEYGRIRAERDITRGRAAILKAYYTRNPHKLCPEEVLKVELNEQSAYPPYVLGRLFSVLEAIQDAANPGINTTIKDRYFNSACATPAASP